MGSRCSVQANKKIKLKGNAELRISILHTLQVQPLSSFLAHGARCGPAPPVTWHTPHATVDAWGGTPLKSSQITASHTVIHTSPDLHSTCTVLTVSPTQSQISGSPLPKHHTPGATCFMLRARPQAPHSQHTRHGTGDRSAVTALAVRLHAVHDIWGGPSVPLGARGRVARSTRLHDD